MGLHGPKQRSHRREVHSHSEHHGRDRPIAGTGRCDSGDAQDLYGPGRVRHRLRPRQRRCVAAKELQVPLAERADLVGAWSR